MDDIRPAFGERVLALRNRLKLTQENLAERAGLPVTDVSGIERGLRSPRLHVVDRLAQALDVTLAELFIDVRRVPRRSVRTRKGGRPPPGQAKS